ncbi:MAG: glucosyltransferase domain-containing protein [Eubacteriales bacterium]|nr:glucosyltransferase domain-containing protein [Eubacteriales bacterium]
MVNESKEKSAIPSQQLDDINTIVHLLTKEISWNRSTRLHVFFGTLIFALAFHFQAYTWYYLGHDASRFYNHDVNWDIVTGRFGSVYIKGLYNFLQAPYLIGVISSCFTAITILLLIRLLNIKTLSGVAMLTTCIIAWPSYISQHTYLYMLPQFSFSGMSSVLAVYIMDKYDRKKELVYYSMALPALIASLATYQVNIGVAAGLLLICIVIKSMERTELKAIIIYGFKGLLVLLASLVVYYVLWQYLIDSNGLVRTGYRNMDQSAADSIIVILRGVGAVYAYVFNWFIAFKPLYIPAVIRRVYGILFCLCGIHVFYLTVKKENTQHRFAWLILEIVCFLLLPIAMNAGQFLNPSDKPYAAMLGGMLLPIFLMITCIDRFPQFSPPPKKRQ